MLSMLALARYTAQPFSKHSVDVNQNMCGMGKCTNNIYWPIAINLLLFALNYNGIYNEEMCACVPLTTGLEL